MYIYVYMILVSSEKGSSGADIASETGELPSH